MGLYQLFAKDIELGLAGFRFNAPGLVGVDGYNLTPVRPDTRCDFPAGDNPLARVFTARIKILETDDGNLFLEQVNIARGVREGALDETRLMIVGEPRDCYPDRWH